MFPARGENVKLGKGSILFAIQDENGDENGFDFAGNVQGVAVSSEISEQKLFSSTQSSGALVDKSRTRIDYTLTLTGMNEFTFENLKLFLAATTASVEQTSASNTVVNLTNVKAGKFYDLGARQVTNVTVESLSAALVEGTDYTVNSEFGIIRFLESGSVEDDDDIQVEYDRPALTIEQLRIATSGPIRAHVLYLSDDATTGAVPRHDELELWKVDIAPEGELNLIAEDYNGFSLTMGILSDAENHPDDPFGLYKRAVAS